MSKIAIVTGSATGIGAATAIELSRRGWSIAINYSKSAESARKIHSQCKDSILVQADVGDDAECRRLVKAALDKWGRVDALVNNAGTTKFVKHQDLEGLSADDFLRIYRLNVVGPFQMVRACAAALKRAKGAVVNVSSVAAQLGTGSSIAYAASKSALNAMTVSLARVLGPEVRVNAVCPGYVDTPMTDASVARIAERTGLDPAEVRKRLEDMSPQRRLFSVDEVVALTLYLCSDAARGITGQALSVDGGTVV